MKIQVQKDLELSEMRFSHLSNFVTENQTKQYRKKSNKTSKSQQSKRKEPPFLRAVINKQKVSQIQRQFARRLKLLIPHSSIPSQLFAFRKQPNNFWDIFILKLEQTEGFKLGPKSNFVWKSIILLKVIITIIVLSFLLAFNHTDHQIIFVRIIQFSLLISFVDIPMNFTFQKFQNNKNIKNILSISRSYAKKDFIIDFTILLMNILLKITTDYAVVGLLLLLNLLKLWRCLNRIQVLQHVYITSVFHEKYYTIGRVLFFNYMIAHFIGIIAILMTKFDDQSNWLLKKQLQYCSWLQQYVWAVYWAVNIMLTVGFGDIAAANKNEAIVLIFVETFSCIILAYNINIFGSILTDIKQKQRQRKHQLRVLLKMSEDHEIDQQIVEQSINYVDQSFQIKQKFLYDQHDQIIKSLPENIQQQYIRQTNKKMLLNLPVANLFSRKSLLQIALRINRKLAHPQEIIWKKGQPLRLIILNKGKLGLVYRRDSSILNGKIIQKLQIKQKSSKLLSMNFFKNQRFEYDLKSTTYSIVYHLSNQQFALALSQKNSDYQLYCSIRDKSQFRLQSGQIYECTFCPKQRHDYFNCPKMHLVIPQGHVINKYIFLKKNFINERKTFPRQKIVIPILKYCKLIKSQQQFFTQKFFNQIQQIRGNSQMQTGGQQNNQQKYFSRKTTSIRSNIAASNILRDLDIQRLNTFLVAKLNEQGMYVGFWDVECDAAYNWITYFRNQNSEYLCSNVPVKQQSVTLNYNRKLNRTISLPQH